jgi:O-antigen/teichoic acid export membrane protein
MEDLKARAIRGGLVRLLGQVVNFATRLGFVAIMARLLEPAEFGLVAMVTAITGIYDLFTSAGLSSATVQKEIVNNQLLSTLFWFNVLVGILLAILCVVTAPLLVAFYDEPRLFWITVSMAAGFLFNAAGVQHYALLQRHLQFVALTVIEMVSNLSAIVIAIGMAWWGFSYWALVASAIATPAVMTVLMWSVTKWVPGRPRRDPAVGSMLHFGATVTLNGVVVYIAYNLDKVLLGRRWGADALGIYGRAYQLVNIPISNLNSAVGGVAFSALARLQNDPIRFRNYFLKGYGLVVSLTMPTALFLAVMAEDIVLVVLGPKWTAAADILRLLAPTVLVFGVINPLGWLMVAIGLQGRSLRIALAIAPIVITAYFLGLPYGIRGIAFAYSAAMLLWMTPHVLWCLHATPVSPRDFLRASMAPALASLAAALAVFAAKYFFEAWESALLRLLAGSLLMAVVYAWMLLFVMGQKETYLGFFKGLIRSPRPD